MFCRHEKRDEVREPFDLDTFFASAEQAILVSFLQSAKVSSNQLKEVKILMRAKQSSLLSVVHILSLGFFCGLILIPLGGLLLRSLVLYYRGKRKASISPVALYPLVRTERGMVIHVIPQSLVENEREDAPLPVMAR